MWQSFHGAFYGDRTKAQINILFQSTGGYIQLAMSQMLADHILSFGVDEDLFTDSKGFI